MKQTIRLCGSFYDATPETEATIVESLAVHRPVYQYMRGAPVTVAKKGWTVSHVATGLGLGRMIPDDTFAKRADAIAWAQAVQAVDPEAWAQANEIAFGGGTFNPKLAARLREAGEAVAA